jgi:hypothetical protein
MYCLLRIFSFQPGINKETGHILAQPKIRGKLLIIPLDKKLTPF